MSTSRLFHAVVGVGIALGALSVGCAVSADPTEESNATEAAQTQGHDPFCEVSWPTTKGGGGPRPSAAQSCIDPHHQCGDYPGVSSGDHTANDATIDLTKDFHVKEDGHALVGAGVVVNYDLERLPQCQTSGTDWNITGFYSENGGPPQSFEVTEVAPDGHSRVAKAARIVPTAGGDVALWFKVSNAAGCSQFDSDFGANFHVAVKENPSSSGEFEMCATKKPDATCATDQKEAWLFCTTDAHGPRWTCPHGMVRMSECSQ
jgi:hypothetical protein